ncbi:MAG: AraC family transcriptional regulator [Bacteroidota bacterium]
MVFDFGMRTSLLLLGFVQGIIFVVLSWRRGVEEERLSDRLLAVLLLLLCLYIAQYMLGFAGWYDSHNFLTVFMFYFPFHHYLLIPPIVFYYFRSLTNSEFKLEQKDWWHFLPGALYILWYLLSFLYEVVLQQMMLGVPLPLFYETKGYWAQFNQDLFQDVIFILGFVSTYFYLVLTFREYSKYKTYVEANFSQADQLKFTWLRNILIAVIIGFTLNWMIILLDAFVLPMTYRQFWFSHLGVAILIYFLSILGYSSRPNPRVKLAFDPTTISPAPTSSTELDADLLPIKDRLAKLMKQEHPYLNPELNLKELAQGVRATPSQLSKVINSGFGKNFNDFINEYRVEAIKEKLRAGEAELHTLMSIALDCGFNSKATFNRAFKKFTAQSPKAYLEGL